jgi:hypothetical protein
LILLHPAELGHVTAPTIQCQTKALDNSPQKVYSCSNSQTIQSPGKLSAQPQPSGDGDGRRSAEGFESEASEGLQIPSRGFFFWRVIP